MDLSLMILKVGVVVGALLGIVPLMVWVERRGSALMQNRLGPNRVGPWGLLQSLADVIKFLWKEDPIPGHVRKGFYLLAPLLLLVPAFMTFAVIPFGDRILLGGRVIELQITSLNVGVLYLLSISSLSVYGVVMAGWASRNPYALLGGLRSASQMVSYELALGLSMVAAILTFSTVDLNAMVLQQYHWKNWGIFLQPIGFLIFCIAAFAETNRLPFDLPEGESEIIAGYHLEYGAMKFALFMMSEYLHMTAASCVMATVYLGGWQLFPGFEWIGVFLGQVLKTDPSHWIVPLLQVGCFLIKVFGFLWLFVWVRWTLPRFRYDQLMDLGWKGLLPLAFLNLLGTALLIHRGWL